MGTEGQGSALDSYARLIKSHVSPALREVGLTGSSGQYALTSATHWAMVGFQKSAHNSPTEARFTINLLAVPRPAWEAMRGRRPSLPARPLANGVYGEPVHAVRIGHLIGDGHDTWWRITSQSDAATVVDDALATLVDVGLPWLRARLGDPEE